MNDKRCCDGDRFVDQHVRHVRGNLRKPRQGCRRRAPGFLACGSVERDEKPGKPHQVLARRVIQALKAADGGHHYGILAATAFGPFEVAETV